MARVVGKVGKDPNAINTKEITALIRSKAMVFLLGQVGIYIKGVQRR